MTKARAFPPGIPAPLLLQNALAARKAQGCAYRPHTPGAADAFLLRPAATPARAWATAPGCESRARPSAPECRASARETFRVRVRQPKFSPARFRMHPVRLIMAARPAVVPLFRRESP